MISKTEERQTIPAGRSICYRKTWRAANWGPTTIIGEITAHGARDFAGDVHSRSLTGFFRLQDASYSRDGTQRTEGPR